MLTVYCPLAWLSLIFLVLMSALNACLLSSLLCMHSSQSESHLRVTVTESRLRAIEGVAPTGTHTELRLRAIEGVAPTGTHTESRLRAIDAGRAYEHPC